ncbi:MAG: phosphate acyltransferase PlsX [Actinobacteria bacterium]|nr:phosphate acyltransferase PlsX [Actinomycetota bacterium]
MVAENYGKNSIIVDAMGGDHAPGEIIRGCIQASRLLDIKIILIGDEKKIRSFAIQDNLDITNLEILNASQEIEMDESPSEVVRTKRDSSIYLGTKILGEGKAGAFLSAGNTGAVMACALYNARRIEGIQRPAIAVVLPLAEKRVVLIDAGANVDVKPVYLKQFAIMGKAYAETMLSIENPAIGLINVGSEEKKGSEVVVEAYKLLKNSDLNFKGNVEGRDIFEGKVDVAVCDGFVGNILLKAIEGMANLFFTEIKNVFLSNFMTKLVTLGLKKPLSRMKRKFDYEEYGGAYLLGVDGLVIISHGSSRAKAISNAIRVAATGVSMDLVGKIRDEVKIVNKNDRGSEK